jgi:hypothetical protein
MAVEKQAPQPQSVFENTKIGGDAAFLLTIIAGTFEDALLTLRELNIKFRGDRIRIIIERPENEPQVSE